MSHTNKPIGEEAQSKLDEYRKSIDNIDAAVINMLAERFKITQKVGAHKAKHKLEPADKKRESEQISLEQAKENLVLTKLKIIDRIEALPQLFYKKWWINLTQNLSTQVWQILTLFGMWFIFILQLISQFTSLKNKLITKIFSAITVIILLITQTSYHNNFTKKEAIVFSETITVNSAPTSSSNNLFTLHAGSKVEIIDIIGDWINIKIANGNSGWIAQNSIKEL